MKKWILVCIALACTGCCIFATPGLANELIFEERIESDKGAPVSEVLTFDATGFEDLVLRVENGEQDGSRRISSAEIALNGTRVVGPSDLNQKVDRLERSLAHQESSNTLSVKLRSKPGEILLVRVFGNLSLNLPPDPGEAGDATLEGVDVNGNGVRDDIERWIGLTYRDSKKARLALTQAYYAMQGFMIHADQGDRDAVYDDMTAMQRAGECIDSILPERGYQMLRELKARVVNTAARVEADRQASRMLGGGSFPGRPFSKWKEICTFDPDALEN
ncbi:MAG: hypothetical protein R6V08_07995 [Desulfuromonadales bacterium]